MSRVGVPRIGQQAPPRRGGKPGDAEFLSQGQLGFPSAAAEVQQPFPVHPALDLRLRRFKGFGAQRPQEQVGKPRFPGDEVQRTPVLAHGPLSQNFPGEQEIKPRRGHQGPGLPEHEGVAVDAGVMAPPKPVGRIINEGQIFFGEVHFHQGQAQVGGRFPGPRRPEKRGDESNEGDVDPLGAQHCCGQHAVQPAGKEPQGPNGLGHGQ